MGKFSLGDLIAEGKVSKLDTAGKRDQIEYIDIDQIDDDPKNFYELSGLDALAANIELLGLQQPIRVRPNPDDPERVIIVSGHRRRAAIRTLVDEGKNELREIPCIREVSEGSEALQELRLIYANSDTRKMSSAEISKQAERVEALLYQLKEEGYDFPGRMRDHVAEACNVSKSKLARLKVIRENLTPYFTKLWDDGKIVESVAYEFAQMEHHHLAFIECHQNILYTKLTGWGCGTASTYRNRLNNIDKATCKDGAECSNRKKKYEKALHSPTWDSDTTCARCCGKCDQLVSCKYACLKQADKAKKLKADKKAREKQAAEAQRERDKPITDAIRLYWDRFGRARDLSGTEPEKCWKTLGLNNTYHGDYDKIVAMECGEHDFNANSSTPYGWRLGYRDIQQVAALADLLGTSLDYLFGRTDEPTPKAAVEVPAKPADDAMALKFKDGKERPRNFIGRKAYAKFTCGRCDDDVIERVVIWNGENWCFEFGDTVEATCIGWYPLPEDEEDADNDEI